MADLFTFVIVRPFHVPIPRPAMTGRHSRTLTKPLRNRPTCSLAHRAILDDDTLDDLPHDSGLLLGKNEGPTESPAHTV
jgi:hypothetical protein